MKIHPLVELLPNSEGLASKHKSRKLLMNSLYNLEDGEFGNFTDNSSWLEENDYWEDECYPIHTTLELFHTYYIPFIIFIGLLGNLLSCIVFLTTHLKMRSSSYYLAALAMADFGFLSVLLIVYLSNTAGLELFNKEGWCQTMVYTSSVCSILSVWLIVAFTVERFIAVQYPLQRPHMCTVSRAKCIVLVLTAVALLSQSYSFVTAGMVLTSNGTQMCEMLDEYHDTMRIINIVDTIISLIGPFVLIVSMNTMIARNLLLFRRRFQHGSLEDCFYSSSDLNHIQTQSASSNRLRNNSNQSQHSNKSSISKASRKTRTSHNCVQLPRCIHMKSSGRNLISAKNQQSITKMLLLISSVFIILNFPSYVIRLYVFFFYSLWRQKAPVWLWCVQQFVMLLYYTNFSINFLLYAMCGITFRRCLRQLVRKNIKTLTWRRPCVPQRSESDGQQLNELRRD